MITRSSFGAAALACATLLPLVAGVATAQGHGTLVSQGRITSLGVRPDAGPGHAVELDVAGSGTCDLTFKGAYDARLAKQKLPASQIVPIAAGPHAVAVYSANCAGVAATSFVGKGELESLTARPIDASSKDDGTWSLGKRVRVIASGRHGCDDFVLYESGSRSIRELTGIPDARRMDGAPSRFSDTLDITPSVAGEDTLIVFPGATCAGAPMQVVGRVKGQGVVAIGGLTPSPAQPRPGTPVLFTIRGPQGARCDGAVVAFGDGQSVSLQPFAFDLTVSHTYRAPGTFTARVEPDSRARASCEGSAAVTVNVQAPRLDAISAPNETVVGRSVAVQLQGAPATCGDIQVAFGDGTSAHVGALPGRVDHTYRAAGTHEITAVAQGNCTGAARASILVDASEIEKPTRAHTSKP